MNFCTMITEAIKLKNFVYLLLVFGLLDAIFVAFGVVLDPFFEALDFTPTEVSILGGSFVIAGVVSSIVTGILLDKYRKYNLILRIISFGSTIILASCYGLF